MSATELLDTISTVGLLLKLFTTRLTSTYTGIKKAGVLSRKKCSTTQLIDNNECKQHVRCGHDVLMIFTVFASAAKTSTEPELKQLLFEVELHSLLHAHNLLSAKGHKVKFHTDQRVENIVAITLSRT